MFKKSILMKFYTWSLFLFLVLPNSTYTATASPFRFSPRANKAHLINWYHWGADIFKKAKKLDKLVFLDLTAIWCHWCHVLDETTLTDPEVIRILNKDLISVRVDTDKRPDINRRYNQGGWPSIVFLAPTGEILFGATYVKPVVMIDILKKITDMYKAEKGNIYKKIELMNKQIKTALEKKPDSNIKIQQRAVDEVMQSIKTVFDPLHGGFGTFPKFHHPSAIRLSFLHHHKTQKKQILQIITRTLDKMAEGKIFDRVEGGFFRYSTTQDWSKPHFEKMLEENAGLLQNYLEAYWKTGKEKYEKIAKAILAYVEKNLKNNSGGFYASQDADDIYFSLDLKERKKRPSPYIDKTIITSLNGKMISAYLMAGNVLREKKYYDFAIKSIKFLISSHYKKGKGFSHYISRDDRKSYFLSDQVSMFKALLDAYELSGDILFLNYAKGIAMDIKENYFDSMKGHLRDRPTGSPEIATLRIPIAPKPENAIAAENLIRLYYFTFNKEYFNQAEKILKSLWQGGVTYNIFDEDYALGLEKYFNYPISMVIVGNKKNPITMALFKEVHKIYEPRKIIQILDPLKDEELIQKKRLPIPKTPGLFICDESRCSLPITKPQNIVSDLHAFLKNTR